MTPKLLQSRVKLLINAPIHQKLSIWIKDIFIQESRNFKAMLVIYISSKGTKDGGALIFCLVRFQIYLVHVFFFGADVDRGLFQHHSSSFQSPPFSLAEPKISCTSVKYHWRQKSFSSLFNNQNQPNIISSHKAMSQVIKFP